MVTAVLRRSSRLAAAAARSEPIAAAPKPKKVSVSLSQKAGCGSKKVKEGDVSEGKIFCTSDSQEVGYRDSVLKEIVESSLESKIIAESRLNQGKSLKKMPSRDMEVELWEMGFQHIVGVDEAGRGPLAGPVVAAACIIPSCVSIEGIDDSKKITEIKREELYHKITSAPGVRYAVHVVDAAKIDEINILQATMEAMRTCVQKLSCAGLPSPDFILVDGNRLPENFPKNARSVVKGDAICHVIAAASIVAKVTRDRLMHSYDKIWPEYGFKIHKGYGTSVHVAALMKYGPCDIHRRSFAPLKNQDSVATDDYIRNKRGNDEPVPEPESNCLRRTTRQLGI